MDTTLSNMKEKINNAQCALPLFTCLHVKPDVSELMFAGMFSICVPSHLWKEERSASLPKKSLFFLILQRIVVSCSLVHFEIISLMARIRKEFSMIWNILWGLTKFALLWTEYREIFIYKKNRKLWCWRISGIS